MSSADRLELLRLFVRIAEAGSLTEAARSVGLTQPSASRALKQLEAIAGTKLVARSTHALSLTPSGDALLERARRLLLDWDAALEAAQGERGTLSGRIRVIAPVAVGQTLLARLAARFVLAHRDVSLQWELHDGPVDMVAEGCDLWIQVGTAPRDDLVTRRIFDIPRAVVAASFPCVPHPRDLAARPAVHLTSFTPASVRLTNGEEAYLLRQRAAFATDSLIAAHIAALEGVGYAILPLWLATNDIRSGALAALCPDWRPPNLQLSLAYLSAGRPTRVRALIDFLEAELTGADGLGPSYRLAFDATQVGAPARSDRPRSAS